jgi:hypothetical protein
LVIYSGSGVPIFSVLTATTKLPRLDRLPCCRRRFLVVRHDPGCDGDQHSGQAPPPQVLQFPGSKPSPPTPTPSLPSLTHPRTARSISPPRSSTAASTDFHSRIVKLTNQFRHPLIYIPLCFVVAATREASGPRSQRLPMYVRFTSPFGSQFCIDDVLEMCRLLLQCCQQDPTT